MVFCWHFTHAPAMPNLSEYLAPVIPPLALFDEGHIGVALFMTLSGYLFAKLLDGKQINYAAFFWNRFLRLAPLLTLVIVVVGAIEIARGGSAWAYLSNTVSGLWLPTWPNGGWSVTVEMHFYVLLPVLLAIRTRWPIALAVMVLAAIVMRIMIYQSTGQIWNLAYWTIIGRIDQFLLGILAFQYRHLICDRLMAVSTLGFVMFYWLFDMVGGYLNYGSGTIYTPVWILMPTVEAVAFAIAIAWYDRKFQPKNTGFSRIAGLAGGYSYSIYLLHWFWVHDAAAFIDSKIMDLSNFYVALTWSFVCFALMIPIGYLSYRFVEAPFLRLRRNYYLKTAE